MQQRLDPCCTAGVVCLPLVHSPAPPHACRNEHSRRYTPPLRCPMHRLCNATRVFPTAQSGVGDGTGQRADAVRPTVHAQRTQPDACTRGRERLLCGFHRRRSCASACGWIERRRSRRCGGCAARAGNGLLSAAESASTAAVIPASAARQPACHDRRDARRLGVICECDAWAVDESRHPRTVDEPRPPACDRILDICGLVAARLAAEDSTYGIQRCTPACNPAEGQPPAHASPRGLRVGVVAPATRRATRLAAAFCGIAADFAALRRASESVAKGHTERLALAEEHAWWPRALGLR